MNTLPHPPEWPKIDARGIKTEIDIIPDETTGFRAI